jgi:hypothetical protein
VNVPKALQSGYFRHAHVTAKMNEKVPSVNLTKEGMLIER